MGRHDDLRSPCCHVGRHDYLCVLPSGRDNKDLCGRLGYRDCLPSGSP